MDYLQWSLNTVLDRIPVHSLWSIWSSKFLLLKKGKTYKVWNSSALLMQTYFLLKNECIYAKE